MRRPVPASCVPEDVAKGRRTTKTAPLRLTLLLAVCAVLTGCVELQQEIVANMHEILQSMIKTEDFQEAVNLLLGVQKAQQDVLDMTEQEKQDRIRRLIPKLDQ